MCVFTYVYIWYQLDVEVSRVVDVRHHSVELCVDLGDDSRVVEQRPVAQRHRGVKPTVGFDILIKV